MAAIAALLLPRPRRGPAAGRVAVGGSPAGRPRRPCPARRPRPAAAPSPRARWGRTRSPCGENGSIPTRSSAAEQLVVHEPDALGRGAPSARPRPRRPRARARGCRAPAAAPSASRPTPRASAAATSRVIRLRKFSKSACVRCASARYSSALAGAREQLVEVVLDVLLGRRGSTALLGAARRPPSPRAPASAAAAVDRRSHLRTALSSLLRRSSSACPRPRPRRRRRPPPSEPSAAAPFGRGAVAAARGLLLPGPSRTSPRRPCGTRPAAPRPSR